MSYVINRSSGKKDFENYWIIDVINISNWQRHKCDIRYNSDEEKNRDTHSGNVNVRLASSVKWRMRWNNVENFTILFALIVAHDI